MKTHSSAVPVIMTGTANYAQSRMTYDRAVIMKKVFTLIDTKGDVCSVVAMKDRVVTMKKKAFTLIELLVVVSIIALLVSILLPALARARSQTRRALCATGLHSWSIAFQMYAGEHNDELPPSTCLNWPDYGRMIWGQETPYFLNAMHHDGHYMTTQEDYTCPEVLLRDKAPYDIHGDGADETAEGDGLVHKLGDNPWNDRNFSNYSFTYNFFHRQLITANGERRPTRTADRGDWLLMGDRTATADYSIGKRNHLRNNELEGGNFLFLDGHAEWFQSSELTQRAGLDYNAVPASATITE
ncbi:MAG: type II secretion system protein [Sedimentisphaerales bacterium]|nr:type II secretion system protein [Sedimentisphaerales bacterium]